MTSPDTNTERAFIQTPTEDFWIYMCFIIFATARVRAGLNQYRQTHRGGLLPETTGQ
jgi:hypothetical protein